MLNDLPRLLASKPESPLTGSNWLSFVTFFYTIPIFRKGTQRDIDEYDLSKPHISHKASILGEKLAAGWCREKIRAEKHNDIPNLTKVLYGMFAKEIVLQGIFLFITEIPIRFFQPLFLGLLVRYFTPENQNSKEPAGDPNYMLRLFEYWRNQSPIQINEAYFLASGLLVCSMANVVIVHPCMMSAIYTGMKLRTACCSLIFRKTLRLDLTSLSGSAVGNIVNLLANDVTRFDYLMLCFHYLWIAPLQVLLTLLMLYQEVGVAAVFGITVMTVFIPLQAWFGNQTSRFRLITAYRTDERVNQMNEVIQGMQVIKMYTWEYAFAKQIHDLRRLEIKYITATSFIRGAYMSFLMFAARVALFVTVVSCIFQKFEITAEKVFVVASFYQILRHTLTSLFPYAIAQIAEAHVSITRIKRLLMMPESKVGDTRVLDPEGLFKPEPKSQEYDIEAPSIVITNGSAAIDNEVCLHHVNFQVDKPQLIAVIGPVGAGKSSLLNVILGEVELWLGSVRVSGSVSYSSQEPWLFAGSVRQNILFGQTYDKRWYNKVIEICALAKDFKMLPYGDFTPIGEKGVGLSGGQRARVTLARAIYKNADIYLLDDPLSAVDSQVGKHLFEHCIREFLSDKIVILVTHQLQFITDADKVIIMDQGTIIAEGTYEFLESTHQDFGEILRSHMESEEIEPTPAESVLDTIMRELKLASAMSLNVVDLEGERFEPFVSLDGRTKGSVGGVIYKEYFKAGGSWCSICFSVLLFVTAEALGSCADVFLAEWVSVEETRKTGGNDTELLLGALDKNISLSIYSLIIFLTVAISLGRSFYFFVVCMRASINLHDSMFRSIITASMHFFNTHTSGQILNRFSRDLGAVDDLLPNAMLDCFQIIMNLFGILAVVVAVNYYLALPTVVMCVAFFFFRSYYLKTSRSTKRLEGRTRSPLYSHLSATVQGLATIRSNSAEIVLTEEFDHLLDDYSSSWFMFISTARAFGYWIDIICVMYIGLIGYSFLFVSTTGSRVGLAITTAIGLTGVFQWGIKQSAEVENQMISVERVLEYTKIEREPDLQSAPDKKPPPDWPAEGRIEFRNLSLRYSLDSAPVLRGLTFTIYPQEKIGIVGRTGAGKSSMIATLFRLAYFEGTVLIDDIDTGEIGLHDLRRKISIIPQDPVLFSGTLRYNMDPFNNYDDVSVLSALLIVENKIALAEGMGALTHHVSEGGVNISVGERQLICLARAILRNNRILVMDEATANVDPKTDQFIQTTIRQTFSHCTVLTIAHRLHTIMDYDKVLVVDAGKAVEFDHPHRLLQRRYGYFTEMIDKTGRAMAKNLRDIAKHNYELKH